MSLEPPQDKSTAGDKVGFSIFPKANRMLASSNITKAIESNKLEFQKGFSPHKQRENMRGIVTSIIVGTFGVCILAVIGVGVYKIADKSVSLPEAVIALKALGDFLSSHVVPIITLVLGFYFGSEKK